MLKNYLLLIFVFAFCYLSFGINPNGITGNFSICLPGPLTTQLSGSGIPASTNPWTSSNPAVATVDITGLVTATGAFGATTITYQDNLGNFYAQNVYVSVYPTMSSSSGNYTLCTGGTLQLEGSVFPNPTTPWQSSDTTIATVDNTGLVTGIGAGVANITYTNLGGCTVTRSVTINPLLSPTITCGTWLPNQTKRFDWNAVPGATTYTIFYNINGGAYTFGATGNILTFTVSNVLQTDIVSIYVTPSGPVGNCFEAGTVTCQSSTANCPEAGTSGSVTVCDNDSSMINLFTIITGEDAGGVWTRTDGIGGIFNATSGTFIPAGATTSAFIYTVTGSTPCPNDSSLATITINAAPNAGVLSGVQNICVGFTTSFTSTTNGGVWSSSNPAIATVNPVTGVVTGNAAGVAVITYTVLGAAPCSNASGTRTVTVNATPSAGTLSGDQTICYNDHDIVFTSTVAGGTWTSSDPSVATINPVTGQITPVGTFGTTIMMYVVLGSGRCANGVATRSLTLMEPGLILTSGSTAATVCANMPIEPIIYTGQYTTTASALNLPPGITADYNNGILTLSGIPTMVGVFEYELHASGECDSAMIQNGIITVSAPLTTVIFCDSTNALPNSIGFDWNPIAGAVSYQFSYSIAGGDVVYGTVNASHYEILDVPFAQGAIFTLTNVPGVSCFEPVSVSCYNLASSAFESLDLQYYPNPVRDVFKISSAFEISQLELINTLSERILSKNVASKVVEIDFSSLAPGIYLVKVSANHSMKMIKIIKD